MQLKISPSACSSCTTASVIAGRLFLLVGNVDFLDPRGERASFEVVLVAAVSAELNLQR